MTEIFLSDSAKAQVLNATLHAEQEYIKSVRRNARRGAAEKIKIRYIQKAIGYTLTGSTAEECVFFLYGTGRNGKSTFLEIIREIFGDYAANIQPETIMVKGFIYFNGISLTR